MVLRGNPGGSFPLPSASVPRAARPPARSRLQVHRPDAVTFVSQEVYRAALFAVFCAQVLLAGVVPRVGPALNFLLLSWLYALYCFDYKWSLHAVALTQRVAYFERHWAFFLGAPWDNCQLPAVPPPPAACAAGPSRAPSLSLPRAPVPVHPPPPPPPPPPRLWRRHGAARHLHVLLRGRRAGGGAVPPVDHDGVRLKPQAGVPTG